MAERESLRRDVPSTFHLVGPLINAIVLRTLMLVLLTAPAIYFYNSKASGIKVIFSLATMPTIITLLAMFTRRLQRRHLSLEEVCEIVDYMFPSLVTMGLASAFIGVGAKSGFKSETEVLVTFVAVSGSA